jgi:hypothetical protein
MDPVELKDESILSSIRSPVGNRSSAVVLAQPVLSVLSTG